MTTPSNKPQFLLLLRQPNTGPGPSPEELQEIMKHFGKWMEDLYARDLVLGTNGLKNDGLVLRGPRGQSSSDGPFIESKEIVGGYVLIQADSFEDAVEIGRNCPGLNYAMAVEVRPVQTRK